MKISVIFGHPRKGSFNHAIAKTAVSALKNNGYEVIFHDLYKEKFDPIVTCGEIAKNSRSNPVIKRCRNEISRADGIVVIHPNWWGQPPAVLKGWLDRVMCAGVAYNFKEGDKGEGVPIGLLKARVGLVFNTSDTRPLREKEVFGDPLETIWKNCIFGLCGVKIFYRKIYSIVVTSTLTQRKDWLEDVRKTVNKYFP